MSCPDTVAQRTREIGIRVALGAQRADVSRMVVAQGIKLGAIGTGIGLIGAIAVAKTISALLFGVDPIDPITIAATCTLLGTAVVLASYLPARRATQVNPVDALRSE